VDVGEMTAGDVTIRTFRDGDERRINDGFNAVFGLRRSLEEWAWKFPPDPDGRTIMLAEHDGELLAHYAGAPVRFHLDGHTWPAAQIVDVFSTRNARAAVFGRRGVWVRTVEAFFDGFGRSGRLAVLFGFPSPRPLRLGVLQLGYDAVEPQALTTVERSVVSARRPLRSVAYRAELSPDWDPRLDGLWQRVRSAYPAAVVRDAQHALYRYAGHPTVRYHRFVVLPRFGREAVGWGVFRIEDGVCRLVDLLWDRAHPGALDLLSWLAAKLAAQTGCGRQEAWLTGDTSGLERFRKHGWIAGPEPRSLVFVARAFAAGFDVAALDGRVYITMGDSDLY
jgi:hypothetical protein